jgi:hypothetical protein
MSNGCNGNILENFLPSFLQAEISFDNSDKKYQPTNVNFLIHNNLGYFLP